MTDLHIPPGDDRFHSIDTKANFLRALDHANLRQGELLVISGDIAAEEGDEEIYQWVRTHIQDLACEVFLIAGNHDSADMMSRIFAQTQTPAPGELTAVISRNDWQILFLDTSSEVVSSPQVEWLTQMGEVHVPSLLFMHHPPVSCGANAVDSNYPLAGREKVAQAISGFSQLKGTFCGHYHSDDEVSLGKTSVCLTPSTAFQVVDDPRSERGWRRDLRYGYRDIVLSRDSFSTEVHYI